MENKHVARRLAEKNYKTAHAAWVASTNQTDEAVYLAADAALEKARQELVAAETIYPTSKEISKRNRRRELSSRGLDV